MAFLLDSLLVGGIKFVLDKVASAVDNEMNDEGSLREELLAAQMRFELGEIEEDELADLETTLMARLREIRESRGEGGGGAMGVDSATRVIGVDLTFGGEEPGDQDDGQEIGAAFRHR